MDLGSSSSSSPLTQSALRLWRPSAQRNLRNQWSKLASQRHQWSTLSSTARSHATALVNAYLSQTYLPKMELGVFSDMPNIKDKACLKLLRQQELHRTNLLSSYKDMVTLVAQMFIAMGSMRLFLKGTDSSPVLQFSSRSEVKDDLGDGGGIPIFNFLSVSSHEELANELVQMFLMELSLKRLLVLELLSIGCDLSQFKRLHWTDKFYPGEFDDLRSCNMYNEESHEPFHPRGWKCDTPAVTYDKQPNREVLEVYLTTWIAEVNIDNDRADEILAMIGEEMHVNIS